MAVWSEIKKSDLEGAMRLDAEYYQPDYLEFAEATADGDRMGDILQRIMHPVEIKRVYDDNYGIQILLAQNIRANELDFSTMVFMPESVEPMLSRNRLKYGDVVVTRSGANYGDCAVYLGIPENIYACADCLVLRPKEGIDGRYLSTYLNSAVGRGLIKRGKYGAAQPHIAPTHIREIRVPRLGVVENRTCQLVSRAQERRLNSIVLYGEAERLVLWELGFGMLDMSPTMFYERRYSEVRETGRFDAEFYQPKYYALIDAIRRTGEGRLLGEIVTHCERGLQPVYDDEGDVSVVNSKHMGAQFLCDDFEHCSNEAWERQKKAHLREHDVLFYSTGAYIGRTNCWFGRDKAVGSNHVTIIRPNGGECNPVYLALFMNSQAGLMQAERYGHGSAQREVYPSDLRAYTVWVPGMKKQEKLAQMVLDARAARDESRELLEEAKRMVEEAVLRG